LAQLNLCRKGATIPPIFAHHMGAGGCQAKRLGLNGILQEVSFFAYSKFTLLRTFAIGNFPNFFTLMFLLVLLGVIFGAFHYPYSAYPASLKNGRMVFPTLKIDQFYRSNVSLGFSDFAGSYRFYPFFLLHKLTRKWVFL